MLADPHVIWFYEYLEQCLAEIAHNLPTATLVGEQPVGPKILLRPQDLKTTQFYLHKVSDSEAIRWTDILHGD